MRPLEGHTLRDHHKLWVRAGIHEDGVANRRGAIDGGLDCREVEVDDVVTPLVQMDGGVRRDDIAGTGKDLVPEYDVVVISEARRTRQPRGVIDERGADDRSERLAREERERLAPRVVEGPAKLREVPMAPGVGEVRGLP